MIRILGALAVVLVVAGCVQPEAVTAKIDAGEMAKFNKPGSASVKGSALLRQSGGGVVTCAGNEVYLMADTAVTRQAIEILGRRNRPEGQENLAGRYPYAYRVGMCDAQGFFKFDSVAAGSWWVATPILWQVGYSVQGGWLGQRMTLSEGQAIDVVLSSGQLLH